MQKPFPSAQQFQELAKWNCCILHHTPSTQLCASYLSCINDIFQIHQLHRSQGFKSSDVRSLPPPYSTGSSPVLTSSPRKENPTEPSDQISPQRKLRKDPPKVDHFANVVWMKFGALTTPGTNRRFLNDTGNLGYICETRSRSIRLQDGRYRGCLREYHPSHWRKSSFWTSVAGFSLGLIYSNLSKRPANTSYCFEQFISEMNHSFQVKPVRRFKT